MRYALIIILAIVFMVAEPTAISTSAGWPMLHHFFHGNVFHLVSNALAIWFVLKRWKWREMAFAYTIASLSVLASPVPVMGFSNMIYALIGLRTPSLDSPWWKNPVTLVFLSVTMIMFLIPGISATTHVISLGMGVIVSSFSRWINGIRNDCRRYTDNI